MAKQPLELMRRLLMVNTLPVWRGRC